MGQENVIPVVGGRTETTNSGVETNHLLSDGVTDGVGIKATVDRIVLRYEGREPAGMGPGSGSGYAQRRRMQEKATHGVDGGFAEHDHRDVARVNGEVAEVFSGTRRHATPASRSGAAEFGADGFVFFSK